MKKAMHIQFDNNYRIPGGKQALVWTEEQKRAVRDYIETALDKFRDRIINSNSVIHVSHSEQPPYRFYTKVGAQEDGSLASDILDHLHG
jgi:hypothetical protein